MPAILFVALAAVPFVDRTGFMSPRRRLVIVAAGAVVAVGLAALGLYAWLSPVVQYMLASGGM